MALLGNRKSRKLRQAAQFVAESLERRCLLDGVSLVVNENWSLPLEEGDWISFDVLRVDDANPAKPEMEFYFDWGDGSEPEYFVFPEGEDRVYLPDKCLMKEGQFTFSVIYAVWYPIFPDVATSFDYEVYEVDPQVSLSGPLAMTPSGRYDLELRTVDPGYDPLTWKVNWGDGSPTQTIQLQEYPLDGVYRPSRNYSNLPNSGVITITATAYSKGDMTRPFVTQPLNVQVSSDPLIGIKELRSSRYLYYQFNQNVGASLSAADLELYNLSENVEYTLVARAFQSYYNWGSFSFSNATRSFQNGSQTLTFPILLDGNYESILNASSITGSGGRSLDANNDGVGNDDESLDYIHQFHFLAGDLNNDRVIDEVDQQMLYSLQYGMLGDGLPSHCGDIDGDGSRYGDYDAWILSRNFGVQLPPPPTAPNSLIANAYTNGDPSSEIQLTWTAPAGIDVDGFRIWRSENGVDFVLHHQIDDDTARSWIDRGLDEGKRFTYRIRAFTNAEGNSHTTNKFAAVTTLKAPTLLQALNVGTSSLMLTWQDNSNAEDNYVVQKSVDGSPFVTLRDDLPVNSTSFPVTGLTEGKTYTFRVFAKNTNATSGYAEVSASMQPAAPTNIHSALDSDGLAVWWEDSSQNETGYLVEWTNPGDSTMYSLSLPENSGNALLHGAAQDATVTVTALGVNGTNSSPLVDATDPRSNYVYRDFFNDDDEGFASSNWSGGNDNSYFGNTGWEQGDKVWGTFGINPVGLALDDLPAHTILEVHVGFLVPEPGPEPTTPTFEIGVVGQTMDVTSQINGHDETILAMRQKDVTGSSPVSMYWGAVRLSHSDASANLSFGVTNVPGNWAISSVEILCDRPKAGIGALWDDDFAIEGTSTGQPHDNAGFRVWGARDMQYTETLEVELEKLTSSTADITDHDAVPVSKTVPVGSGSTDFWITPTNDDTPEWTETVTVRIKPNPERYFPDPAMPFATVEIVDDDPVDISIQDLPEEIETPPNETSPGAFIAVNDDDDNENGVLDNQESAANLSDDDLVPVTLSFQSDIKEGTEIAFYLSDPLNFRVWSVDGNLLAGFGSSSSFNLHASDGPTMTVLLEALAVTSTSLLLQATDASSTTRPSSSSDTANSTGAKIELTATKGKAAGTIAEADETGAGAPGWYINVNWDDDDKDGWSGQGWQGDGTLDPNFQGQLSLNPTYTGDKGDAEVSGNGVAADDDLWRFTISAPGNLPGQVKLTFPGKVKVWRTATKKDGNASSEVASGTLFAVNALPSELYLEGIDGTANFKEVPLKVDYVPQGQEKAQGDQIDVTVFEIKWQGFFGGPNGQAANQQADNDKKFDDAQLFDGKTASSRTTGFISFDDANGDGLNKNQGDDINCLFFHNTMELQGSILPTGSGAIAANNIIAFDLIRRRWAKEWTKPLAGNWGQPTVNDSPWTSDDPTDSDEDLTPSAQDHIYHIDGPGYSTIIRAQNADYRVSMGNFLELAAVRLYGEWYEAAKPYRWHSQVYLVPDPQNPGQYTRGPMDKQKLGEGWISLTTPIF